MLFSGGEAVEAGGDKGGEGVLHVRREEGGGKGAGKMVADGRDHAREGAHRLPGRQAQGFRQREEIGAAQAVFLAVEGQGEFFRVLGENQPEGHQIVRGGKFPSAGIVFEEGEVLEMHVGIAGQEAEQAQLEEAYRVQPRGVGVDADGFADLFHGTVVFLGRHLAEDLAEVLHVAERAAGPVHAAADVGEFAGVEPDQSSPRGAGTGSSRWPKRSRRALTLSRRRVGLPASTSRTKRSPTPARSAKPRCVSPCALRCWRMNSEMVILYPFGVCLSVRM